MPDLVQCAGLAPTLERAGVSYRDRNFEEVFAEIRRGDRRELETELEEQIRDYFSGLMLPDEPTIYDRLVMFLRPKDLIATFNWDPLLLQAFRRALAHGIPARSLPQIAFLHGSTAVGICNRCNVKGYMPNRRCGTCGQRFEPCRLLYPIADKDYTTDAFIADEWRRTRDMLKHAYIISIFGYGAPAADAAAVELLRTALGAASGFMVAQREVEIIDIAKREVLEDRLRPFFTSHHYGTPDRFDYSQCSRFPRRSCEGLASGLLWCDPWPDAHITHATTLDDLAAAVRPLLTGEGREEPAAQSHQR